MQKTNHPIEVALVLAWLVAEALLTLLVGAVALAAAWKAPALVREVSQRAAPRARESHLSRTTEPTPPPAEHPLITVAAAVADPLQRLTVADLRRMARSAGLPRTLTRSGRRSALLTALVGLEVAVCG